MDLRRKQARSLSYLRTALLALGFLLLGSGAAYSQTRPTPTSPPPEPSSVNPTKPDSPDFGSPESEMRAKAELKAEKKQYDENLTRARDAAQLATEIVNDDEAKKEFSSEDGTKLERLETLTKKMRNATSGAQ